MPPAVPALIITITVLIINFGCLIYGACLATPLGAQIVTTSLISIVQMLIGYYCILFILGLLTTITEWKKIKCPNSKKILYLFTFPLFMLTYIPIAICAMFKKVKWVPIPHNVVKSLNDVR